MKRWHEIWSAWLLLILISFGALETLGWNSGGTLSRTIWDATLYFGPLVPMLYAGLFVGLAVHFWWHWNPPGSKSEG